MEASDQRYSGSDYDGHVSKITTSRAASRFFQRLLNIGFDVQTTTDSLIRVKNGVRTTFKFSPTSKTTWASAEAAPVVKPFCFISKTETWLGGGFFLIRNAGWWRMYKSS